MVVVLQPEVVLVSSLQPLADDEAERVVVVAVAEAAHLQHGLLRRAVQSDAADAAAAANAVAVVGRRVGQLLAVDVGHGGSKAGLSVELKVGNILLS